MAISTIIIINLAVAPMILSVASTKRGPPRALSGRSGRPIKLIIINKDPTSFDQYAEVCIHEDICNTVAKINI